MRTGLYIFDLGVERYADRLREAEKARVVQKAKKGKRSLFRLYPFWSQLKRSA